MSADLGEVCADLGAYLLERAMLHRSEEIKEALTRPDGAHLVCQAIETVARGVLLDEFPHSPSSHHEWMAAFAVSGCRKRLTELAPLTRMGPIDRGAM